MSSTTIPGSVTLTPIGAVDTSSASSGVSMFTLNFDSTIITAGNIIQFEYWINAVSAPQPALANGFIPLEDAVTTQGISNQCTIAIPSQNNVYNPTSAQEVMVRVYVGSPTSAEILVSEWSNTCPLHNPPAQTGTPVAYIVRGEEPPTYYYGDELYVQIPDNTSYTVGEIEFVVSYSYKDQSGAYQWVVSQPQNWTRHTFSNLSVNRIVVNPIQLPSDVFHGSPIYVAVNAVFNYSWSIPPASPSIYYSVSEISDTVKATDGEIQPPTLETIDIPDNYLVYSTPSSQEVVLNWLPPASSSIPNFSVASYEVVVSVGSSVIDTISGILPSTLTYTYSIPEGLYNASTVSQLSFVVVAYFTNGANLPSDPQTVNTFRYATAVQNLIVDWANSGSNTGEIDLALTFNNPVDNGLGAVVNFVVNVVNDAVVVATKNVSYVAGAMPYVVYFDNISATLTGSVQVYMVNTDTNAQTVGGTYAELAGASASANYVADDLPILVSHTNDGSVISANWVTHTLADRVGTIETWNPDTEEIESQQYLTIPGTYPPTGYPEVIVTRQVNPVTNDFEYNIQIFASFFSHPSRMGSAGMNMANSSGIGFGLIGPNLP